MAYRGAMSNPDECAYKAKVDSSSEADGPGFPSAELDTRRKTSLIVGGGASGAFYKCWVRTRPPSLASKKGKVDCAQRLSWECFGARWRQKIHE